MQSRAKKSGMPKQQVKRKQKLTGRSGCQENLQHGLGVQEKVMQTAGNGKGFWKVNKEVRLGFSSLSILCQKAALRDKPAAHDENGDQGTCR